MTQLVVQSMAAHHEDVWKGEPWYGSNITDGLGSISPAQATYRVSGQHNIAEILLHMAQWKKFVLEKLRANPEFNIELNGESDWKQIDVLDTESWNQLLENFHTLSREYIDQLKRQEDHLLETVVPGRKYTFSSLLQGITEHDIYHFGQIYLLKKIAVHEV